MLSLRATKVLVFGSLSFRRGADEVFDFRPDPKILFLGFGPVPSIRMYINFLPWVDAGKPSKAGVFVLTNCDSLQLGGNEVVATLANDVLLTMQGVTPPEDKSNYPRVFGRQ